MNITEHEMRGLLTGKCLPGDMRVNEGLPAYLIRKFDELKAQCGALAAENAAFKSVIEAVRGVANNSDGISGWHRNGDLAGWDEILPEIEDTETPATDAYLNSVRAEGVEMLAAEHQAIVDTLNGDSLFADGELRHASIAAAAVHFAAQLRAGKDGE